LRITALPAAKAGAILCATVLSGELNGVIATTTPSGTRSVKPMRPDCCGAPASGTTSPARRRASSAESFSVWMQRRTSPVASEPVNPASICIVRTKSSSRGSSSAAARSRMAPRSKGPGAPRRNAACAQATACATCFGSAVPTWAPGSRRYLSITAKGAPLPATHSPSTSNPCVAMRSFTTRSPYVWSVRHSHRICFR
jgi:hypothetical protein